MKPCLRFRISHRYVLPTALGGVVAVGLALAPTASAKTLQCGKTTLVGTSQNAANVAYNISATGLSCKSAKPVIKAFGSGKSPEGWKATNRYVASDHSLKWTLKKGHEVITFEVKKTS